MAKEEIKPWSEGGHSRALEYAQAWASLPPAHLKAAIAGLEPEMAREHERWLFASKQDHVRQICGILAGSIVALTSIGGAIYFGTKGQLWGAVILTGPSIVVLTKLLVLRRLDPGDMQAVTSAAQKAYSTGANLRQSSANVVEHQTGSHES